MLPAITNYYFKDIFPKPPHPITKQLPHLHHQFHRNEKSAHRRPSAEQTHILPD